MKFKLFLIILAAATFGLAGCSESSTGAGSHTFFGTWTEVKYWDSIRILEKNNELIEEKRGYIFREDGTMVERAQASFCGRPGYYKNYDGIWEKISNKILDIHVGCWDGETNYRLSVESVNENSMRLIYKKQ